MTQSDYRLMKSSIQGERDQPLFLFKPLKEGILGDKEQWGHALLEMIQCYSYSEEDQKQFEKIKKEISAKLNKLKEKIGNKPAVLEKIDTIREQVLKSEKNNLNLIALLSAERNGIDALWDEVTAKGHFEVTESMKEQLKLKDKALIVDAAFFALYQAGFHELLQTWGKIREAFYQTPMKFLKNYIPVKDWMKGDLVIYYVFSQAKWQARHVAYCHAGDRAISLFGHGHTHYYEHALNDVPANCGEHFIVLRKIQEGTSSPSKV